MLVSSSLLRASLAHRSSIVQGCSQARHLFAMRGIPLRRRTTDFSVYVVTTFVGIAGGIYIFMEPLRQLRLEQLEENNEEQATTTPAATDATSRQQGNG